jgi:hypothetical protein
VGIWAVHVYYVRTVLHQFIVFNVTYDSRKISFPILFPGTALNWWGITVFRVHRQPLSFVMGGTTFIAQAVPAQCFVKGRTTE